MYLAVKYPIALTQVGKETPVLFKVPTQEGKELQVHRCKHQSPPTHGSSDTRTIRWCRLTFSSLHRIYLDPEALRCMVPIYKVPGDNRYYPWYP